MTDGTPSEPTRADVDARWRDLVEGRTTREEAHDWAMPWVENVTREISDPMTLNGLQHLHGFNLRSDPDNPNIVNRGSDWPYLHPAEEIAQGLERWRRNCARFDADPVEYVRVAREAALAELDRDT